MTLNKSKIAAVHAMKNIELWYGSMKTIEGHFGSAVGTYFKFLRWLFSLDLILLVLTFRFYYISIFSRNSGNKKKLFSVLLSSPNVYLIVLKKKVPFQIKNNWEILNLLIY